MLKRNTKGELTPVKALRVKESSIYRRGTNKTFSISRSKLSDFLECKRCFYLDRVKRLNKPSIPQFTLNITVDALLKKEFDNYRSSKKPHPIFIKNKLNFIPFAHSDLDTWRDALHGGISYVDKETNLEIHGGIDDLWFDVDTKELVVADYKAQANDKEMDAESYLASPYHQNYKIQMNIYVYILRQMGFTVANRAFFLVCNAENSFDEFDNKLNFTPYLIPYITNTDGIKESIVEMKKTLESVSVPKNNIYCEHCAYLEAGKEFI
jgi:CRISPR/Cas system-associated exonuclease Cas4 (RecB family)